MQPNLNVERQYNKMSSIQDMIGHLYSINLNMNYIDNLAMFVNAVHRILTEHILNCFVKKPCGYFCR